MKIFAGSDEVVDLYVGSTPVAAVYNGDEQIWPWAQGVNFDGTNDYLTRGAGLTGASDSKLMTFSLWAKVASDDALFQLFAALTALGGTTAAGISIQRRATNVIRVLGRNAAGATILQIETATNTLVTASGWVNILASFDMADTGKRFIYLNDVLDLTTVTTYTDDTLDFTTAEWIVGAVGNATLKLNGDMVDMMFWSGVYIDLSVEANRRLFISAAGKPVNPAVAIAALGTPIISLTGPTADWHTNKGSGGGFTENGALTDAATSPSD